MRWLLQRGGENGEASVTTEGSLKLLNEINKKSSFEHVIYLYFSVHQETRLFKIVNKTSPAV